jgi:heme oxygenase (mycobilin-producing)
VYRVMLRMQIKPGRELEFEQVWASVGTAVTGHRANLGQWLARSDEEDGVYYIASDWVDEAQFREFEHSEAHVRHRALLQPMRASGSMNTANVVFYMPSQHATPGRSAGPASRVWGRAVWRAVRRVGRWVLTGLTAMGYANVMVPPWQWGLPRSDRRDSTDELSRSERQQWTALEGMLRSPERD